MNNIELVGNITKDPELKFTPSGKAVASFSIAVTQYKNDKDEWISDFFNCTAWGNLAQNIAESITRGTRVIISGKLFVEKWTDKDGAKRQSTKIRVESLGPELSYAKCIVEKNPKQQQEGPVSEYNDEDAN